MTDPTTDRAAERPLNDRITEVLDEHHYVGEGHCRCGRDSRDDRPNPGLGEWHRAHVAAVLADLMGDGLADAWDEGVGYMAERCVDEHGVSADYRPGDNPYPRVTDDGEDA